MGLTLDYTSNRILHTKVRKIFGIAIILGGSFSNLEAQTTELDTNQTVRLDPMGVLVEKKDTTKAKQTVLEAPVFFTAKDSINNEVGSNTIEMYNDAKVEYQNIKLRAGYIFLDKKNNYIFARGLRNEDSSYVQKPIFTQGGKDYHSDSIIFNMITKKAITFNVRTKENEGFILGDKIKKENDSIIYVKNFKFTGDEKKNPDYYIYSDKVKIIQNEWIIASNPQLYVSDVPTPFWAPFGMFQTGEQNTQGILFPTYGENQQGFFLQNFGYYLPVGDYVGLKATFDKYTRGGFGMDLASNYNIRYLFNGRINYNYQLTIQGEEGRSDYQENIAYRLTYSHSQDSKASPNSSFSASVNYSSTEYYSQSLRHVASSNQVNAQSNSTINYTKRFPNKPFTLSVNGSASQNFRTRITTINLPSFNFNVNRLYPFSDKLTASGKNWYEKINIGYSSSFQNSVTAPDSLIFENSIFSKMKNGAQHNIPISVNLKAFDYFTITPSINYREQWAFKKLDKTWNTTTNEVVSDTLNGFFRTSNVSGGAAISTQVFGMFQFWKGSFIEAIRHVASPSISYSFSPNYKDEFFGYQKQFQQGKFYGKIQTYNPYSLGVYNPSVGSLSNNLSFSLSNNFEAKIRSDDPKKKAKKIKLLDFLNLSTGYNFSASEFNWSDVSLSTATSFFNDRLSLNYRTSYDWYAVDNQGNRVDILYYKTDYDGLLPWRQKGYTLSSGFHISDKDFSTTTSSDKDNNPPDKETKPKLSARKYADAGSTWRINFNYSFSKTLRGDGTENEVQNLSFSGRWKPSRKWNISMTSGWDFINDDFSFTSFQIAREMDSWNMSMSWTPFGAVTNYNFNISLKSSILRDLVKYDERSNPNDYAD